MIDYIDIEDNKIIVDIYVSRGEKYITKKVYNWLFKDNNIKNYLSRYIGYKFYYFDKINVLNTACIYNNPKWITIYDNNIPIKITKIDKIYIRDFMKFNIIKDLDKL